MKAIDKLIGLLEGNLAAMKTQKSEFSEGAIAAYSSALGDALRLAAEEKAGMKATDMVCCSRCGLFIDTLHAPDRTAELMELCKALLDMYENQFKEGR